ncbi:MAG: hypothetical protein TEF_17365 [Rhizobiales bacterium NRL2]|jgi:hypothetical protein|nr:MAG: hypothetical protein TEF_17365 [Rhizobiales bacterium NRL2]
MGSDLAHVEARYDPATDVVMFRLWGQTSAAAIFEALERHFQEHPTCRFAIWDFRRVDLNALSVPDLMEISRRSAAASAARREPRTALVMRDETNYLLGKVYDALSETGRSPIEHRVFYHLPPAFAWFGVENAFDKSG